MRSMIFRRKAFAYKFDERNWLGAIREKSIRFYLT